MAITPTYPGVYIQEIPSGVHTIMGVATSITAFVGRARSGPDNEATVINTFGDYERIFGGLWAESSMSYAVRDYFRNGGSQAIVVRLYHPEPVPAPPPPGAPAQPPASPEKALLDIGALTLEALYRGSSADLRAAVEMADAAMSADAATALGVTPDKLFHLTVRDAGTGTAETHRNMTVEDTPRRIDRVLRASSRLVRWRGDWPAPPPQVAAGKDAVSVAEEALAAALRMDPAAVQAGTVQAKKDLEDAKKKVRASDGEPLAAEDFTPGKGEEQKKGIYALEGADLFNILCIPPYKPTVNGDEFDYESAKLTVLLSGAVSYCERRRAMLLIDPPSDWTDKDKPKDGVATLGTRSANAALFFPRVRMPNPLQNYRSENFAPCGMVAGIFARTDANRGVWKAPAGLDATLRGVRELSVRLTDPENGELNPLGVNCLRIRPAAGAVVWGARTLQGDDRLMSEWKYIPVRRTALFIEESLYRGTQWVVFEPNDRPLWAQIRLNGGAFMHDLFRQGAFQGEKPQDAYFVKCDDETTTQNDIDRGIVNIVVGFAPLKPAEFVIIKLQQIAGQIET